MTAWRLAIAALLLGACSTGVPGATGAASPHRGPLAGAANQRERAMAPYARLLSSPARQAAVPGRMVAVPDARFAAMLEAGRRAASKVNVQFGEILGISAPGGGEILRVHSAYNMAKGIEASALDEVSGLLRPDAKAVRSISVQTLVIGSTGYLRPTTVGAKWTKERLRSTAASASALPSQLVALAGPSAVSLVRSTRAGTSFRIRLRVTDLALLRSLAPMLAPRALAALSATDLRLLSGVVLSLPDVVVTLDHQDRVTQLEAGGKLTETRADARARHSAYPRGGVEGVVLLTLVYRYGGALAIAAPPARQVLDNTTPRR